MGRHVEHSHSHNPCTQIGRCTHDIWIFIIGCLSAQANARAHSFARVSVEMARQRNERNEKNKEREVAIEGQRDYKNGIYIFDESVFYFIPFLFHLFHYLWNAFSETGGLLK